MGGVISFGLLSFFRPPPGGIPLENPEKVNIPPAQRPEGRLAGELGLEWRACHILGIATPADGRTAEFLKSLSRKDPKRFLKIIASLGKIDPWQSEFEAAVSGLGLPSDDSKAFLKGILNPSIREAILNTALESFTSAGDYDKAVAVLSFTDADQNRQLTEKQCALLLKGDPDLVFAALGAKKELAMYQWIYLSKLGDGDLAKEAELISKMSITDGFGAQIRYNFLQKALAEHPDLVSLDDAARSLNSTSGQRLEWLGGAVSGAARNDLGKTVDWVKALPNDVERNFLLERLAGEVGKKSPQDLEAIMTAASSQSGRSRIAAEGAAGVIDGKGVEAGYDWARGFADPQLKEIAETQLVKQGWRQDRDAMLAAAAAEAARNPAGNTWDVLLNSLGIKETKLGDNIEEWPAKLRGLNDSSAELIRNAMATRAPR